MDAIERSADARTAVAGARSVVAFTGAGVSAESGVPTYRDAGGLWRNYQAEDLATMEAFRRDPATVWEWYGERRRTMGLCEPNAGHCALATLEERLGDGLVLVTQNIDALHHRAGSRRVLEIHGNAFRTVCSVCDYEIEGLQYDTPKSTTCPSCGAWLRPDVVWFGEPLDEALVERAFVAAAACDLFLSIGSSLLVQPAASLPEVALSSGARIIEVNMEPTWLTPEADWSFQGPAGEVLPALVG